MERKYWNLEKELKTKTVKELAVKMFNYYKGNIKELFGLVQSVTWQAIKWDDVYKEYREDFLANYPYAEFGLKKAERKTLIYRELHKELSNLISNNL